MKCLAKNLYKDCKFLEKGICNSLLSCIFKEVKKEASSAAEKFWATWGGYGIETKHEDEQSAIKEAERRASLSPGKKYYVMEVCGVACTGGVVYRKI